MVGDKLFVKVIAVEDTQLSRRNKMSALVGVGLRQYRGRQTATAHAGVRGPS